MSPDLTIALCLRDDETRVADMTNAALEVAQTLASEFAAGEWASQVREEAWPLASISSEIAYMMQKRVFDYLDAPITRVCSQDVPLPYASTLVEAYLPNAHRVVEAVNAVMYR